MRTHTKQESSLSVFSGPNAEKDKINEINDSVNSIYHNLSILYAKLQRLNFLMAQEKEKGERK